MVVVSDLVEVVNVRGWAQYEEMFGRKVVLNREERVVGKD